MKERDFSRKLRKALKAAGFSVWPVETGGTAVGFPDLFVAGNGLAAFIEVKSRPSMTVEQAAACPDLLGPGQRQFAKEYSIGTTGAGSGGRHVVVAVCCEDALLFLRLKKDGELEHVDSWGHDAGLKDRERLAHAIYKAHFGGVKA